MITGIAIAIGAIVAAVILVACLLCVVAASIDSPDMNLDA